MLPLTIIWLQIPMQDLHSFVLPLLVVFLNMFDHCQEIPASTIFHQNVENASVAINIAIVIANNVLVMQVFKDVTVKKHFCKVTNGQTTFNQSYPLSCTPKPRPAIIRGNIWTDYSEVRRQSQYLVVSHVQSPN